MSKITPCHCNKQTKHYLHVAVPGQSRRARGEPQTTSPDTGRDGEQAGQAEAQVYVARLQLLTQKIRTNCIFVAHCSI